ncbi:MAG: HepT-like ribonuclease domain-containing protein [Chloroflexia bacterium]
MHNRLVHLYWEVDPAQIYEILQQDLVDLDRFKAAVPEFIRTG